MAIGRLLYWVTPVQCRDFRHLWVPARFIAPIFITFDVISFLIQFLGVAIIAGTINSKDSPSDIKTQTDRGFAALRLGLILQLLCFALFYLISIRFMVVSKRWRNEWPEGDNGKWRKFGFVINITSGLIVLRSIYRVIEYAGSDEVRGYNESHEWPLYIFDALLMILVFAVFAVFHPAKYLPERYTRFRLRRKLLMAQKPHGSVVYNVSAPEYAPAGYMELGYRR
ncbi:MAG: hypothetical protein M1829_004647 [Trizodia sp. TS-e1964]|nr:MAG: hypothetical protein M1829_004647 [Trizodia sp. TS-e1964]